MKTKAVICFLVAIILASACSTLTSGQALTVTPIVFPISVPSETLRINPSTATHLPILTSTPDLWESQKCRELPSVIPDHEYSWIHEYVGDIEGHGKVNMILNFTENNEVIGFAFGFGQVQEYRVNGCVDGRAFTMWLRQEDAVESVIRGEFPETDPRGHFSSTELTFDIMTGSLEEMSNSSSYQTYFRINSSVAGTMEHRFPLTGVEDDEIILNATSQLRVAIAQDDRDKVVELIHFPLEFHKDAKNPKEISTAESFLAEYDLIFDEDFRERIAITFPNYLWGNAGNFAGTISQIIYGGGLILFDEHGKVIAIYNWKKP